MGGRLGPEGLFAKNVDQWVERWDAQGVWGEG